MLFLVFVFFLNCLGGRIGKLIVVERCWIGAGRLGVHTELAVHLGEELRGVPFVGVHIFCAVGVDQFARNIFRNGQDVVTLIFTLKCGATNRVNRFPLLVHHVVVFEQVLARVEVLRFNGFLRILNATRDKAGFDGNTLGHAEAVHQRFDAFTAEDAHQVVFEREEKPRRAGIALPSGASAQLIINAACFVTLGAKNVHAAERDDFVAFGFALRSELLVYRFPLIGRHLKDFAFVLEEHHRDGGCRRGTVVRFCADDGRRLRVRNSEFVFEEMLARQKFRIAAEENVRAATRHVRGNGDGALAARLGNHARFTLVLLRVQDLMRNAALLK